MSHSPQSALLPPVTTKADGSPRRVGIEIEFSDLSLEAAAAALQAQFGGELQAISRYERELHDDPAGIWRVELDSSLLKQLGRRARGSGDLSSALENLAEEAVRVISDPIVPVEVVSPPLPMARLGEVNQLIERLRAAGARGTSEELAYAFGLQFNPETPATDAATLCRYLQAYLCLEEWLRARANVDWTRRLTAFADPFPKAYIRQVIAADYRPTQAALIDDYLDANPTRNRSLDWLPLFAFVDAERVQTRVNDDRIKPRPAFHYRLPNSEIERPDWNLNIAWADWLAVERLAGAPAALAAMCRGYAAFLERPFGQLTGDWATQADQLLGEHAII